MWRETNVEGVLFAPIVAYGLVALVLHLLVRPLLRLGLLRWCWNPSLAEAGIFVCILSLLASVF